MPKPILDVLTGKEPKRMPIWLMRQAGRYLPEYRRLRSEAKNFLDLSLTPKWAAEITLQPVRRFDLDAAILFADILLIPYALGQNLEFREGEGPVLQGLADENAVKNLVYEEKKVQPVFETVEHVKKDLPDKTALIGFCGGPWTVAAYMIDGTSRDNFSAAKSWAREKPELLGQLIDLLVDSSVHYLCRQIEAGAEVLQIFESWAQLLSGNDFERWIIKPTAEIVARVKTKYPRVPVIGFPREAGPHYRDYAQKSGVDAMSVDQHLSLDQCAMLQKIKTLQGNLDPHLLVRGGSDMQNAAFSIIDRLGPRHIFNLGHGVLPETPPENVGRLVELVRGYKK